MIVARPRRTMHLAGTALAVLLMSFASSAWAADFQLDNVRIDLGKLVINAPKIAIKGSTLEKDAFLALFTRDAVWTSPTGRRLTGLEEISRFTRDALALTPHDVFATYEVEHVGFLGADVAAVNVRSRAVRADRTPIPGEPDGAKLYVLVRHNKDWLFAASHNTFVIELSA